MFNHLFSRRKFLTQTSLGLLSLAGLPKILPAMETMHGMPKLAPNKASPGFKPDVELNLFCKPSTVNIYQGQATRVQRYFAQLLQGPKESLTEIPGSYLGPLIHLHKGQKVRIHLHNELGEPTVTHWHGLHVPSNMDGHPQYTIDSGQTLVYEFEVANRASMAIYHPHPHEATATQVYYGLAGALLVHDDEETALELPSGEFEIPIVIQDKNFNNANQLIYANNMHTRMTGHLGDQILINGKANFQLNVQSRAYRLRFLNGSTARIYKLAWDDGTPLTVIGCDGGLLETPISKPYVMLAPGERLDVWTDFSGRAEGSQLMMRSLAFSGALPTMGMMMHSGNLPMGSDYPIFSVHVTQKVSDSPKLPSQLSKIAWQQLSDTANANKPVPIAISESHMAMLLNGRPYAFDDVQDFERIKVNTVQLLEIFHAHNSGMGHGRGRGMGMGGMGGGMGMMMSMAHPIHLHGQSFQILSRSIADNNDEGYASVKDGFIENGLKDTVLVMPGETVRIIKPFSDFKGLFMYHCHNLEHEDRGMMRDFLVV